MTKVKLIWRDDLISGFDARGHSGYAESGQDIVCAAVSAITQTCELGLTDVLGLKVNVRRSDSDGSYRVTLPMNATREQLQSAQVLFRTLLAGLKSIELECGQYLRIDAK